MIHKKTKVRIEELSNLRGLAIISIVLQHLMGYINHPQASGTDIVILSTTWHFINFGVPAFIFISGFLLSYKYGEMDNFSYRKFVTTRFKYVFIPYIIWSIIYTFKYNIELKDLSTENIGILFDNILTGKAHYHLWYIIMIFQFYLLFPLIQKLVVWIKRKFPKKIIGYFLLLSLLIGQLIYNNLYYENPKIWFHFCFNGLNIIKTIINSIANIIPYLNETKPSQFYNSYSYLFFIYWTFFFVTGSACGLNSENLQAWVRKIIPINIPIWIGLFCYLLYSYIKEINVTSDGFLVNLSAFPLYNPFVSLYTMLTIITILFFVNKLFRNENIFILKIISIVSKYSFGIYLAHPLVLDIFTKYFYDIKSISPSLKVFLTALCTLISIIVVMWLYEKISKIVKGRL